MKSKLLYFLLTVLLSCNLNTKEETVLDLSEEDQEQLKVLFNNHLNYFSIDFASLKNEVEVLNGELVRLKLFDFKVDYEMYPRESVEKISNFKHLKELILFGCDYYPKNMDNLSKLETLHLNLDRIHNFPFEQLNSNTLQMLYIEGDSIKSVPNAIYNFTSLKELEILTNDVPSVSNEIGNLKDLENLVISVKMNTLPKEIKGCSKLKTLKIYSDSLTSLPNSFQNYTELEILYIYSKSKIDLPISLSNCKNVILFELSGIINEYPECINGMDSLGYLEIDCGENGGFDSLSDGMSNLTRLHTLRIENPKLKYLPKSLSQTNLEYLYIHEANFRDYQFPIEYNQLPLKYIKLYDTKIKEFPEFIYDLTTLEELNIKGGYFDSMRNPQPQKNWNNLKSFTVTDTDLKSLPDSLGYCRNLQTVDIQYNRLTTVPRSFANLGERLCFYWFGNPWKTLPKEMDWNCRDLNPCSVGYSNLPPAKRR
ncbi:leucine-rich repeat domain-containing protein [Flammeovirga pacifica]|uniref:Disease resistance R13L4/SHOC-2-like LRR domain-containing protein n=1 Tax=Flammeovirga pacifica TaxID=915059 RepID=A0A1S1YUS2_FLAPC|nr:hypothetical protein [Flammeovirga pacifica]OHX64613.1 hypothetical protein NH26_23875 [Flammeovirga pacifica]